MAFPDGVGNEPLGVAVDPSPHTVYVANHYSNNVSVINEATNTVTAGQRLVRARHR